MKSLFKLPVAVLLFVSLDSLGVQKVCTQEISTPQYEVVHRGPDLQLNIGKDVLQAEMLIQKGQIFVGVYNQVIINVFDKKNGTNLGAIPSEFPVRSIHRINENLIAVRSQRTYLTDKSKIEFIDVNTKNVVASYQSDQEISQPAVIGDRVAIVNKNSRVVVFDFDGSKQKKPQIYDVDSKVATDVTPTFVDKDNLLFVNDSGSAIRLNIDSEKETVAFRPTGSLSGNGRDKIQVMQTNGEGNTLAIIGYRSQLSQIFLVRKDGKMKVIPFERAGWDVSTGVLPNGNIWLTDYDKKLTVVDPKKGEFVASGGFSDDPTWSIPKVFPLQDGVLASLKGVPDFDSQCKIRFIDHATMLPKANPNEPRAQINGPVVGAAVDEDGRSVAVLNKSGTLAFIGLGEKKMGGEVVRLVEVPCSSEEKSSGSPAGSSGAPGTL